MNIKDFFKTIYDRYIGWGEYQTAVLNVGNLPTRFGILSKEHIIMSTSLFLFMGLFTYFTRYYDSKRLEKAQKRISLTMLLLELLRIVWLRIYFPNEHFIRFDYCNQACLFFPILILCGLTIFYPAIMCISFYGGLGVMLYPLWIFKSFGGFHIMSIQSMISHGLMLLTSINLARIHKTNFKKDIKISFILFAIMAVLSFIFSMKRDANYMAMRTSVGVPILEYISFPWHIPFVVGIIFLGLYVFILVKGKIDNKILTFDLKDNMEVEVNEL